MAWVPAAIGAAGSIFGGLLGSSAQARANRTNIQLQREQREWETSMSNTAWQRGTRDLLQAGLNPMLAYSQGPASTPSVSAATVQPEDAMARGVASAADKAMQIYSLQTQKGQAKKINAEADQQQIIADNMNRTYNVHIDGQDDMLTVENNLKRYNTTLAEQQINLNDFKTAIAQKELDIATIEARIAAATEGAQVASAEAMARIKEKEITAAEFRNLLLRAELPEKEAIAQWFTTVGMASPAAKAAMTAGQWLKFILSK